MYRLSRTAIVLTVMLGTGCDSTPTAPSTPNVAGRWGGTTCAPNRPNVCAITFELSQSGSSITGTWGTTSNHGTLTGSVSGLTVSLVKTSTYFPGTTPQSLTLTLSADARRMSGAYTEQAMISLSR